MPLPSARVDDKLPTIRIRTRWVTPLFHAISGLLVLGAAIECHLHQRFTAWLYVPVGLIGAGLACGAGMLVFDRQPKVVITNEGIDIAINQTGLIRWREIVHMECFRAQGQGAVALFVTEEALARVPRASFRPGLPVLANEAFDAPPICFGDGLLDATAHDIAAEIESRRRGEPGPLTKKSSG